MLLGAATKYPGLNLILQDMILSVLLPQSGAGQLRSPRRRATHGLRLIIFAAGTVLGLTAYRRLGAALSLLGGFCSLTVSLVLPTAFYALLEWQRLGWAKRAGLGAMLALGLALVGLVTATNICDMVPACRHHHVRDGGTAGAGAWGGLADLLLGH